MVGTLTLWVATKRTVSALLVDADSGFGSAAGAGSVAAGAAGSAAGAAGSAAGAGVVAGGALVSTAAAPGASDSAVTALEAESTVGDGISAAFFEVASGFLSMVSFGCSQPTIAAQTTIKLNANQRIAFSNKLVSCFNRLHHRFEQIPFKALNTHISVGDFQFFSMTNRSGAS